MFPCALQATVDISSPYEGTVHELFYKEGDVVPTGSIMCSIDVVNTSTATDAVSAPSPAPTQAGARYLVLSTAFTAAARLHQCVDTG